MSFLTVEDVNTANLNHINEFYELDTSKISEQEFDSVLYDFCIVSHSIDGDDHTFTFEICNNLWEGGFNVANANGDWIEPIIDWDRASKTISFTVEESSVILRLYLCSFVPFLGRPWVCLGCATQQNNIVYRQINQRVEGNTIEVYDYEDNSIKNVTITNDTAFIHDEIVDYVGIVDDTQYGYVLINTRKSDLIFNLDGASCTVGIINRIPLNIDARFLPTYYSHGIFEPLIDNDDLDIVVKYDNLIIPVFYDSELDDYCFDLDLTEKTDNKPVKLEIMVNEIDVVNAGNYNVILPCSYSSANSYEELISNIVAGAEIIELKNDITLESNLTVPHDLMIYANNHNVYLGSHSISVSNDVSVEIDDANFFNGINCFIQELNTKLVLNNCKFSNAIISDNYKGSVVSADYDSEEDSIVTELIGCMFVNCHHTIYHGGELTVKNCKALFNSFNDAVDTDYPAFLTAYDGAIEITNSIFDIDYNIGSLCDNDLDIKFAEALVGLGENTVFNGVTTNQLKYNDILPFFEAPFNNKSHIFAKYYYPQIDACVISSPVLGKEDTSVCHMILGTDWVYKNNVQVTRSSWQSENNIRKIDWREI